MQFTAEQIATLLKGRVEGSPEIMVDQLSKIEEASSSSLTFWRIQSTNTLYMRLRRGLS
jgi:UDP-3-O-[3-hydroxymyristoyl] glucosamine N-acyltransferase